MRSYKELSSILRRIDGKGYGAYRDIEGVYSFPDFLLYIDHVQPDPFAPPSRIRVRVPQDKALFPKELFETRERKLALEDYLVRRLSRNLKKGVFQTIELSPCVLERTSVRVGDGVEARFFVRLPGFGRRINGKRAEEILLSELPSAVRKSLFFGSIPRKEIEEHVKVIEDAEYIRSRLPELGIVAFVADGSILPRESGISEEPLEGAIPFTSPPSLAVEINTLYRGRVRGMGVPEGVSLIVGGGYHGKSTLLKAIAMGVYPHIPGDGREFVITRRDAVFIRAEDGRSVEMVDISPFISSLPDGTDTRFFSTKNASGSTSEAANIMEAIEMGASLLLFDEDTSATNLLIRDRRMQSLVHKSKEPITPLVDQIKSLHRDFGISSILIMGGSGDYLDVADMVLMMDSYIAKDVTEEAKRVASLHPTGRVKEASGFKKPSSPRCPIPETIKLRGKIKAEKDWLLYGDEEIDLTKLHQIAEVGQVRAIGLIISHLADKFFDGRKDIRRAMDEIEALMDREGLEAGVRSNLGNISRPRKFEIAGALNRMRSLRMGSTL